MNGLIESSVSAAENWSRNRRHELLRYSGYNQFDSDIYNFALEGATS